MINNGEENIPQGFIDADIYINSVFQEVFGDDKLPMQFIVGVEPDGHIQGLSVGFDPYSLLGDEQVIGMLREYSRWGIVATGQMWEASKSVMKDGEEVAPAEGGHSTYLFFAMWDGELVTSVRVVRPEGCGDEFAGESGLPYGVPMYQSGSNDGRLADAMKFANMMSKEGIS